MSERRETGRVETEGAGAPPIPSKMLAKMVANPAGGWTIANIQTACGQLGLSCTAPTRGSHYKVSSDLVGGPVTVPHKRPIKAPYIRLFIGLAKAHVAAAAERGEVNG